MTILNFWQLLAGLSLFLYGMFHLEDALKDLEGRTFKLFLKKHTESKFSAIFSGTLVTGVMQSSSIVNLMVLSFVGAGILTMRNALGVVLGANIGGTLNSWLVAMLGFKIDMGEATMPIIGLAGIGMVLFKNKKKYYSICKFILGFGLLFLGLDYMKLSMDAAIQNFDFRPYLKYNRIVFLLIGFIITAIIQTSAATIVIVLSALNAKIIPLEIAVVVVLGAELGTTVKIVIGSIGGIAAKKRVALGNSLFNIVSSLIGYIFLSSIIYLLKDLIGIKDQLILLVAFQTFINITGAILFYFFLGKLGDFLEKSFVKSEHFATIYLQHALPEIPDTAVEMMGKEVGVFIERVLLINEEIFHLQEVKGNAFYEDNANYLFGKNIPLTEKYEIIKKTEGEMLLFYSKLIEEHIDKQDLDKANLLLRSIRGALYASKSLKDIAHNVKEFSSSSTELKFNCFRDFQIAIDQFNIKLKEIIKTNNTLKTTLMLEELLKQVEENYHQDILKIYQQVSHGKIEEQDISTFFNLNREVYNSCKSLIQSTKDYVLNNQSAVEVVNK